MHRIKLRTNTHHSQIKYIYNSNTTLTPTKKMRQNNNKTKSHIVRCSKQSFQADELICQGNVSVKSENNWTCWLRITGTVKRICVIQVLNTTLHS